MDKSEKVSIGWRLPRPLVEALIKEGQAMGLKAPAMITMILAMRYQENK